MTISYESKDIAADGGFLAYVINRFHDSPDAQFPDVHFHSGIVYE